MVQDVWLAVVIMPIRVMPLLNELFTVMSLFEVSRSPILSRSFVVVVESFPSNLSMVKLTQRRGCVAGGGGGGGGGWGGNMCQLGGTDQWYEAFCNGGFLSHSPRRST